MFCMTSGIFVITKSRKLPCIQVDSEITCERFKSNNWLQRVIPEGDDEDRVFHDISGWLKSPSRSIEFSLQRGDRDVKISWHKEGGL